MVVGIVIAVIVVVLMIALVVLYNNFVQLARPGLIMHGRRLMFSFSVGLRFDSKPSRNG